MEGVKKKIKDTVVPDAEPCFLIGFKAPWHTYSVILVLFAACLYYINLYKQAANNTRISVAAN